MTNTTTSPLGDERKQELAYLLIHDCGSCHGLKLNGGLGPALTPDIIHSKPDPYLKAVIAKGKTGTAMPPWEFILSADDIDYLVQLLKHPDRD